MFHYEKLIFAVNEMVADFRQNRMTKICQNTRFALKCGGKHHVIGKKGAFKRNGTPKPLVNS